MPKNHPTPKGLKDFLTSLQSELRDPLNRNTESCNLLQDEQDAMLELIRLQRNREISIKQCDKGAGIIILDFKKYMKASYEHLLSTNQNGEHYYTQIEEIELQRSQMKIDRVLKKGLENNFITKDEFREMSSDDKGPLRDVVSLLEYISH